MDAHGQRGRTSVSTPAAPIDEEKDANRHPHKEKLPGEQGSYSTASEYAKDQTEAEECREGTAIPAWRRRPGVSPGADRDGYTLRSGEGWLV